MKKTEIYLTVQQVAEELGISYQKALYQIKTGKLPAKKVGKAFKIPSNYRELMEKIAQELKEKPKRRGRPSRKDKAVLPSARKGRSPKLSEEQALIATQDIIFNNLAKAIQDLVEHQITEALGKKK